jgi:hypothetical protein
MGKCIDLGMAGPDDPIYKGGLRVSSVLGPSVLTETSPSGTDGTDPMAPAALSLEAALQKMFAEASGETAPPREPTSTIRKPRGKT